MKRLQMVAVLPGLATARPGVSSLLEISFLCYVNTCIVLRAQVKLVSLTCFIIQWSCVASVQASRSVCKCGGANVCALHMKN